MKARKKNWFCCPPDNPCEVHVSTGGQSVYVTSKDLAAAIAERADLENVQPKDLVLKALNQYLGRAKALDAWARIAPLNVQVWPR